MAMTGLRYLCLFSGMGAAHIAWTKLGWECAAVAEIEPAACALLRHRLPHVPNLGDVAAITDAAIAKLGRLDVVIGGSPCQDLSIAGKRAGLAGARSGLFFHQKRIFDAAHALCGARWLVWENVPGAFSSNAGADFAVVVGSLAGDEIAVPAGGWKNEGVALGPGGLVEWSVLDAQWFGVAQRRRRVFAVLDTGNWRVRPPVLLEPNSLRGDHPPRREAGQSVAGSLVARAGRNGGASNADADADAGHLIAQAFGGNNTSGPIDVATARNACASASASGRLDFESETFLVQAIPFDTTQITSKANGSNPRAGDPCHPLSALAHAPAIAFGCKDSDPARSVSHDVAPTLRAMGHADSHANAGGQVAVAIGVTIHGTDGTANVASYADLAQCLRARIPGGVENSSNTVVQHATKVRRLTPTECERLQGAPDNWTAIPIKTLKCKRVTKLRPEDRWLKNGDGTWSLLMADGPRYKMLGNSFAVPVIRWIGSKIAQAHAAYAPCRAGGAP